MEKGEGGRVEEGEKGGKKKGKKAREAVCRKDARSGGFAP